MLHSLLNIEFEENGYITFNNKLTSELLDFILTFTTSFAGQF